MNLRKHARGQSCTLRLPGVCSYDRDKVVLAHISLWGSAGMGKKAPDAYAVHACDPCHAALDGRAPGFSRSNPEDLKSLIRALCETHARQLMHEDAATRPADLLTDEDYEPNY